ncbi:hypothetical protein SAMN02745912_03865 [Paramaledivibacter caminithermalis DSM 15212]|uniref:Uncharacterized protein n=1 Tax=Paramaledivibacter caminithermalis (strain DSM 15212 / CIP 107654 / DViRD3) TaxID=1121301 RepID=A0A1M6U3P5_PARC5|nr:hypothetical protein SAMN02745912_03865 [Paramaledivibacter caminithermalis DSM 15212]
MDIIIQYFVKAIIILIILYVAITKIDYLKEFVNKPLDKNPYKILLCCITIPLLVYILPYIFPLILLSYILWKITS